MDDNTPRQASISVGTSSVEVSPSPGVSRRKVYSIVNTSSAGQVITISFGQDAVAGRGFILYPTSSIIDSQSEAYFPFQGRICAIADAANGTVSIMERMEG